MDEKEKLIDELTKFRTVYILDEITLKEMDKVFLQILKLQLDDPKAPVNLIISSGGGSTRAALAMCDFMKYFFTVPLHGVAIGYCHSAATFLLAACDVRKCTPNTTFVIHSNTSKATFRVDDKLKERMDDFLRDTQMGAQMVVDHYVKMLGILPEKARELIARGDKEFDNALSATEAKELGLVTQIVDGKLGIFPTA